jgi:hypothetical protein
MFTAPDKSRTALSTIVFIAVSQLGEAKNKSEKVTGVHVPQAM